MKTRKNRPRKKTNKKGGTTYSIGRFDRNSYENIYEKQIHTHNTPIGTSYSSDTPRPTIFVDILKNVYVHPNTDKEYAYYGFLMMEIKKVFDFQTIQWALEKYLTENVLNNLPNNKMKIGLNLDHIKIHDFKMNYDSSSKEKDAKNTVARLDGSVSITGSIYVYDVERLGEHVEQKLSSKLPQDIVNKEIQQYI